VRRRVLDLIPSIETATALSPKRIVLKGGKLSTREVVDALAKQTGYTIDLWGNVEEKKFDFQWNNVLFWEALDQLCQAAGLAVQPSYGDDRLRLQSQGRYAPFNSYDGAFRVTAGGFQHNRTIDFSTIKPGVPLPRRTDEVTFTFTVHSEPRLPLLRVGDVRLTAAYDSEKNSLLPSAQLPDDGNGPFPVRRNTRYYGGGRQHTIPGEVVIAHPAGKAGSVKLLRGTLPVAVVVNQKPEVVTDNLAAAKGKKTVVGTTTFVIEELTEKPGKQYELKMSLTEDRNTAGDYTWMNSLHGRLEVQDDTGNKMFNNGSGWSGSGTNHVRMTLNFTAQGGNVGKPARLIYHVWTILDHEIGFEFKDLPLP
jgi:hypothetical protein